MAKGRKIKYCNHSANSLTILICLFRFYFCHAHLITLVFKREYRESHLFEYNPKLGLIFLAYKVRRKCLMYKIISPRNTQNILIDIAIGYIP